MQSPEMPTKRGQVRSHEAGMANVFKPFLGGCARLLHFPLL